MFNQKYLQELLSYEQNGKQVLSLYLDTDTSQQSVDAIKLHAKGLIKEKQQNHSLNASAIERYLEHSYDWSKTRVGYLCWR